MDRLAAGIMIALAALVMNGGLVREATAEEAGVRLPAAAATPQSHSPSTPALRGESVMSLLLALNALRAEPAPLARQKV